MPATVLVVDDSPTIRDVVQTVLHGGGFKTLTAVDGLQALTVLRQEHADLVLLDFVMPIMNGYQFCRELRSDETLHAMPVVLMSAKGDKIRGQFVQQTGAVDAITKPFDPRALLAVVEAALRKPDEREADAEPTSEDTDHHGALHLAAKNLEWIEDDQERRATMETMLEQSLTRALHPTLARGESETELGQAISAALTPEYLRSLSGLVRLLDRREEKSSVLAGDLSAVSIAEIIQLIELQRHTGSLTVNFGESTLILYFAEGHIELAQASNLPKSYRLGRFLVEAGVVDRATLNGYLAEPEAERRLIGEDLISREVATVGQVCEALRRQTSELIYEAVRWKSGRFSFMVGDSSAEAALASLGLAPGGLLMEGFRRVDEWQLIEGSFKFDDILAAENATDERVNKQALTENEKRVLAAVNGVWTVRQLVDSVEIGTFDACKILYQFLKSGLVRKTASNNETGPVRTS